MLTTHTHTHTLSFSLILVRLPFLYHILSLVFCAWLFAKMAKWNPNNRTHTHTHPQKLILLMLSSAEKYVLVQRVANLAIVVCQKIVKVVICKRNKNYATIKSSVGMGSIWLALQTTLFCCSRSLSLSLPISRISFFIFFPLLVRLFTL